MVIDLVYNRICVSISDESKIKLDTLANNTNIISKSAIVELALNKFFKDATADSIAKELSEQIVVD